MLYTVMVTESCIQMSPKTTQCRHGGAKGDPLPVNLVSFNQKNVIPRGAPILTSTVLCLELVVRGADSPSDADFNCER